MSLCAMTFLAVSEIIRESQLVNSAIKLIYETFSVQVMIDYMDLLWQVFFKHSATPEYQQIDIQALIVKQWQERDQALFCPTAIQ